MENDFSAKSDGTLKKEILDNWKQMLDLIIPLLPKDAASKGIRHMRQLRGLYDETQTRILICQMEAAAMVEQLTQHKDRLTLFLVRAMEIGAEGDSAAIRAHAESVQEYLEAWEKRKLPSEQDLRFQLQTVLGEQHPVPASIQKL